MTIFTGMILLACGDGGTADPDAVNRVYQWDASNPDYLSSFAVASEVIDSSGVRVGAIPGGELVVFDGKALVSDPTGAVNVLDDDEIYGKTASCNGFINNL